jgi:hypothetical protein
VSNFVTLAELKEYIGDAPDSADDSLLTELLENVKALFESETGRAVGAYKDAGTARTEVKDGTGTADLYLDYPVSALTSVILGFDPTKPDETLVVSDKTVINFATDSRRISRTDGGTFGRTGQSRIVQVVYNFGADLPDSAKLGIKSVCAIAYRRRGSEEVKSESVGAFYSRTLVEDIAQFDPFWQAAIAVNRRLVIA